MPKVYLALGSNLGDRWANLRRAVETLAEDPGLHSLECAGLYETAPQGGVAQPDYLNTVVGMQTMLSPEALLHHALRVEAELGRVRRERWGPRLIDIDVLWYEGETRNGEALTLPHPRAAERGFVLIPWADLAPNLVLASGTVGELAEQCRDQGVRRWGSWTTGGAAP